MLLFIGRPQGPKRARSHRNTVSAQRINMAIFSGCSSVERDIGFLCSPESMKQNSQLTRYCNDSLILGLLAAASCQMESPLSQRRVSSMRSKDVIGALDQQTSKIGVSCLGDPELRIALAGL